MDTEIFSDKELFESFRYCLLQDGFKLSNPPAKTIVLSPIITMAIVGLNDYLLDDTVIKTGYDVVLLTDAYLELCEKYKFESCLHAIGNEKE